MKKFDSIECFCGARTAFGNIGKTGVVLLFVGGCYKNGFVKTSFKGEEKQFCLWCGKHWPSNIQEIFKKAF